MVNDVLQISAMLILNILWHSRMYLNNIYEEFFKKTLALYKQKKYFCIHPSSKTTKQLGEKKVNTQAI